MNPDARTERDGVPLRIYEEPSGYTVTAGSYGGQPDAGISVQLHAEFVGEVPKDAIEEDLMAAFEEAYKHTLAEVNDE